MPRTSTMTRRPALFLTLLAAATLLGLLPARAAAACPVPSFGPPTASRVRTVRAVAAGDFNNDGKADIAAANDFNNTVSILLGDGAGGFAAAAHFPVGRNPNSLALADFNGDGKLDLATANGSNINGDVTVLYGDGAGAFTVRADFRLTPVQAGAAGVSVADFNRDGRLDIAFAVRPFSSVGIMFGDGAGGFPVGTDVFVGGGPDLTDTEVADFNGDSKPDLAVTGSFSNQVSLLIGDGAGAFAPARGFNAGTSPSALAVADFDGDGRQDAATSNLLSHNVSVLLGDGAGGLSAATNFGSGGARPTALAAADFNGDGRADLAVVNEEQGNILILQNDGAGQFRAAANYAAGARPLSLAAHDLNADARPDLIAGDTNGQNVVTMLNACGITPAASAFQFSRAVYGGAEGDPPQTITVLRTGSLEGAAGVDYATADGTADANDYVPAFGRLNFAEGETSKSFTVTLKDDSVSEDAETVGLALGNPSGATVGTPGTAGIVILASDGVPGISVVGVTREEGNSGTTDFVFTASLSNPSASTVTVDYATGGGSATAGTDYTAASGTFSFAPGETTKSVAVGVHGDTQGEITETFFLNFTNPTRATLFNAPAIGTILDDDAVCPAPTFQQLASAPAGTFPWGLAAADFDGDFKLDLAVGNFQSSNISVLINHGSSGFRPAVNFAAGLAPRAVVAGDFNGDGRADLAATGSNFGTQVAVLLGDGAGGFASPLTSNAGNGPVALAVADFDGDGRTDLATANVTGSVSVLLGNGAGGFAAPASLAAGASPFSVAAADFNGDGRPDLAAANQNSNNVSVFLNQGGGNFAPAANFAAGANPQWAAPADFNGDGKTDLAVANSASGDVSVLIGDGAGSFAPAANVPVGERPNFVAVSDFNQDGRADLAVTRTPGSGFVVFGQVVVLFGNGQGGFSTPTHFLFGAGSHGAAAADFNGDGAPDLLVGNIGANDNSVTFLHNGCGFPQFAPRLRWSAPAYAASEAAGAVVVSVVRTGGTTAPARVEYATADGTANERGDYTAARGVLDFAPGETTKSLTVFVTDDAHVEGAESFDITLTNAAGTGLDLPSTATVNINSDDAETSSANPADDAAFFVRQHYRDFLGRDPDAAGLQFWTGEINACGNDAGCREAKRVNVSAAFFLSIEFQETGYLAYRMSKAAYGDAAAPGAPSGVPAVRVREFLADAGRVGRGVEVGVGDWFQRLEANKAAYALEFVGRQSFRDAFPQSLTAEQFVGRLDERAGGVLSPAERAELVSALGATPADAPKRASVLRRVAEDEDLRRRETNRAFVLMQYFGYLRRNPDEVGFDGRTDPAYEGYFFWLDKLDDFNGNYIQAEMVRAFIDSIEYRQRFGQ